MPHDDNLLARLIDDYGLTAEGAAAVAATEGPVVLVNLFSLRAEADYGDGTTASGVEAMLQYAAVSGERLAAVGGTFVHQGLGVAPLWGDERWDVTVVARYPSGAAVLELLRDPEYRAAYRHRRAAVADQRVLVSAPI